MFSILRFSFNSPYSPPSGPSWIQIWSTIEQSVSIAVASAASFRTFALQRKEASAKGSGGRKDDSYMSSRSRKQRGTDKSGFSHLQSFGSKSGRRDQSDGSMDVELLDIGKADETIAQRPMGNPEQQNAAYREHLEEPARNDQSG